MSSLLLWFNLWIMPTGRFGVFRNAYLHFHRHTSAYLQSSAVITSQHTSVDTCLRVFPVVWLWDLYRQISQQGRGSMERKVSFFLLFFVIKWDCRDPATPRIANVYTGPDSPLGGHACVRVCAPHLTDLARQRGFTAGRSARPQAD